VELRAPTLFSVDDNPTPLQTATSVLLTGAISVFLFRSLRRRARRAKELVNPSADSHRPSYPHRSLFYKAKTDAFFFSVFDCLPQRVRSSGVQKKPNNLTEEALESLKLVSASPIEGEQQSSPVQALLGGIAAGVIALILYKFTTTIEASLNRQTISDSFSVSSSQSFFSWLIRSLSVDIVIMFAISRVGC
jgi:hypothetical protein